MIDFICPSCNRMVKAPDASIGKKGKCGSCGEVIVVPSISRKKTKGASSHFAKAKVPTSQRRMKSSMSLSLPLPSWEFLCELAGTNAIKSIALSFLSFLSFIALLAWLGALRIHQPVDAPMPIPVQEKFLEQKPQGENGFAVLSKETVDTKLKSQIEKHIVVDGELTDERLREILTKQYADASTEKGFTHHDSPTNIFIYLYESRDKADAKQGWIAMAHKGFSDSKPNFVIQSKQIKMSMLPVTDRFGLPESVRKSLYRNSGKVALAAPKEASDRFPNDLERQLKFIEIFKQKYQSHAAKENGLTEEEYDEVMFEGIEKGWIRY